MNHTNSVNADPAELAKFSELAHRWWDKDSEFRPLHQINPLRLEWINSIFPVAGLAALDVGCGGGISATAEDMAMRTESAKCSSRCEPAEAEATHKLSNTKNNVFKWSGTFEMERVEANHAQGLKVRGVSRDHLQAIDPCCGSQHGVFTQGVGAPMHHPRPFTHNHRI